MQDRDATGAVMIDIDAELSCWQQMESSATSELVFLFQEWEPAIVEAYQRVRGRSRIPWTRAAPAARRVWQKLRSESEAGLAPLRGEGMWSAREWTAHSAHAATHWSATEVTPLLEA